MKFLLDMGLAQRTVEFLRVVTFRLTDMRAAEVNRRLEDILQRFADQLEEGALISVTDDAVRIRRLPVGRR